MDNNFGIKVSAPGIDVKKASASQLLLSSKYPFLKLDTQSSTSFQTVTLLFETDPPEPGTGVTTTIVYQFEHGYSYTPRVWSLFQTVIAPFAATFNQAYFQDFGVIAAQTPDDAVEMYVTADNTNVYVKVDKINDGLGMANDLIGSSFKFTIFTFVDDLSGV